MVNDTTCNILYCECLKQHCDAACHSAVMCVCVDCYMSIFQVGRQEEVGLFDGYQPDFSVGLCKGHYVSQLCQNSVTSFSP